MLEFNPYEKIFADDPYPVYRRLRDEAPVYHCAPLNFWAISRYADVLEAHRDFKTFSSAGGVTIEGLDAMVPLLIVKDPPEHLWHKALITKVFTPNRMAALEPFIRALVTSLLDTAARQEEFDFVQQFALQVPLQVISELIGIPAEHRGEVHQLTSKLLHRGEGEAAMAQVMQAMGAVHEIYLGLVRERRAHPRNDPITYLIQTEVQDETGVKRRLADDELAFRFGELAAAGHETVAKTIPNGAMAFQRFPAERSSTPICSTSRVPAGRNQSILASEFTAASASIWRASSCASSSRSSSGASRTSRSILRVPRAQCFPMYEASTPCPHGSPSE
jgi:cytochrome P450